MRRRATIAALGPGVTGWAEGDRVIVAAGRPCMECPNCRRGDIGNCMRIRLMAFAYDGAWAEYTLAQAVGLTRVPDNVPLEQAAILADAVSTPYGAVVRTGKVGIGESVGVWGLGGVGTHIAQLARLVGAVPVVAVDVKPEVLERALELGADYAFDAGDEQLGEKIADVTGGHGLDVAFDAVGLKSTFEQALGQLTVGGRLVAVGMSARRNPPIGPTSMFGLTQKQVLGHLGYQNVDISTLASLVSLRPAGSSRVRSVRSCHWRTSRWASTSWSAGRAIRSGSWCGPEVLGTPTLEDMRDFQAECSHTSSGSASFACDQRQIRVGDDAGFGGAHRGHRVDASGRRWRRRRPPDLPHRPRTGSP